MKKQTIELKVRKIWELGKGHHSHQSGSGQHDNRPKRLRTRGAKNRKAIGEGW